MAYEPWKPYHVVFAIEHEPDGAPIELDAFRPALQRELVRMARRAAHEADYRLSCIMAGMRRTG